MLNNNPNGHKPTGGGAAHCFYGGDNEPHARLFPNRCCAGKTGHP